MNETKFLLDSGDPDEYRQLATTAKNAGSILWGATTNPTLIAKNLSGKKLTQDAAFRLQKEIVLEILSIVPGAVSAEVYADHQTKAETMIEQGEDIATWDTRVVVKLPTTIEGFKARTALRKNNIPTNNTLVFSQEQIFAICLHEKLMQDMFHATTHPWPASNASRSDADWPSFISPFVGRLDDVGTDGMSLVTNGMTIKSDFNNVWMLEASVRSINHIQQGIDAKTELITAPLATYTAWFTRNANAQTQTPTEKLIPLPLWQAPQTLKTITSIDAFMEALVNKTLDVSHPLTKIGITKFVEDWKTIIQ